MRLGLIALLMASAAVAQDMPPTVDHQATVAKELSPPVDRHASVAGMGHGDMAAPKVPTLLAGYGAGGFPISTTDRRAQAFFDNGMQLAHAFAHKAAIEAMAEAVRIDPRCAMCLWG